MAQYVKQGNIFGRIGSAIGKGLSEQIPKEAERFRLKQGLQELGAKKNLTPWEGFTELAAIPGTNPQIIHTGGELLKQRAKGEALANRSASENQPKPNPFVQPQAGSSGSEKAPPPSLTKPDVFEKTQEGFIPRSEDQKIADAGQKYNANPQFYGNDPQKAIEYENQVDATNEKIAAANQLKHQNLSKIQDNVVGRLKDFSKLLEAEVPAELYSLIEDEAIQATKSKKEGGGGLTEQQAMKNYGDKLNDLSRDIAKINEVGNWGITLRPAKETLRTLNTLQEKMEKLGVRGTDNYAKFLQSENKLSPMLSYAIAEPVRKVNDLNSFIRNLPALEKIETIAETRVNPELAVPKTQEISPKLAQFVQENEKASPLAIAYELEKKGYDPQTWLQYVSDHPELNLRQRQLEQASTPINTVIPWNDWWLEAFSGIR